jgi:hypothetical protein
MLHPHRDADVNAAGTVEHLEHRAALPAAYRRFWRAFALVASVESKSNCAFAIPRASIAYQAIRLSAGLLTSIVVGPRG